MFFSFPMLKYRMFKKKTKMRKQKEQPRDCFSSIDDFFFHDSFSYWYLSQI